MKNKKYTLNLEKLILFLALFSSVIIIIMTFNLTYNIQKEDLIENSLENNYIYADKLARTTDDFIEDAQQQLKISALSLSENFNKKNYLEKESERLLNQTDTFNSVLIANSNKEALAVSPEILQIKGKKIDTPGVNESINLKIPYISHPYISIAGNLLVFVSHPIFDGDKYLGFVAGTIYLKNNKFLSTLLGSHNHRDGTIVYVIDRNNKLIYHHDTNRIGENFADSNLIDVIKSNQSGEADIKNNEGVDLIMGYSTSYITSWTVVVERTKERTLSNLNKVFEKIYIDSIPLLIICFLFIFWSSRKISKPLNMIAENAKNLNNEQFLDHIKRINSWYFEAQEIKESLILSAGLFHKSVKILKEDLNVDALTQLGNRRRFEGALIKLQETNQKFSILCIDIDYFKRINDSYGHDAGDEVLKSLSAALTNICREDDMPCRIGGEEFTIILPGIEKRLATQIAERLRSNVEKTIMPIVERITISIGVASYPEDSSDIKKILKFGDEMLYKAKNNGRNRVEAYNS